MCRTKSLAIHAFGKKVFTTVYNFNGSLESKRIFRAASEKSSSDKFINALLVASQVTNMRCWVDRRVRLVIILASAGLGKSTTIMETR